MVGIKTGRSAKSQNGHLQQLEQLGLMQHRDLRRPWETPDLPRTKTRLLRNADAVIRRYIFLVGVSCSLSANTDKDETLQIPAANTLCVMAFPIVQLPESNQLELMPDTSSDELQARIYDSCHALTTTIEAVNEALGELDGKAYQFSPALRNWRVLRWEKLFAGSDGQSRQDGESRWMKSIGIKCTVLEPTTLEVESKPSSPLSTKASSLLGGRASDASKEDPGLSAWGATPMAVKRPARQFDTAGPSST
ncbi:hypothetical protein AC579_4229 [Pseudocercospora musae]|uniref:Uncharacterized protein n=1 Tax=Pseudocercospora musae TaxID=113226 RepID=A0A139ID54_9PEZI|nr:hypothetical protein AC579_4229 [Pseudocercospora musae]